MPVPRVAPTLIMVRCSSPRVRRSLGPSPVPFPASAMNASIGLRAPSCWRSVGLVVAGAMFRVVMQRIFAPFDTGGFGPVSPRIHEKPRNMQVNE